MRHIAWAFLTFYTIVPSPSLSLEAPNKSEAIKEKAAREKVTTPHSALAGDASFMTIKEVNGTSLSLQALATSVAQKADRTDLGSGIPGIIWRPFQSRILITKSHQKDEEQSALDIQVNTRVGSIKNDGGVGNGMSITSRSLKETKYGQFNFVAVNENYSELLPGDAFFGHTGASLYINQHSTKNAPGWGYAAEVKETHGLSDPVYGSLAGENAIIATGTDAHRKRAGLFIPLNILPGNEDIFTEAGQGWYVKTATNARFIDGGLFEGDYLNAIRANDVKARSFINITGNFSGPIIDLHAAKTAGNDVAVAINGNHSLQWQSVTGVPLGSVGYDSSDPTAPTIQFTGAHIQNQPDGGIETVININGKRYGISLRPIP